MNNRDGKRTAARAEAAGRLDSPAGVAAVPVRARRRARAHHVQRVGPGARESRLPHRGGRDRRRPRVSRRLRRHRAPRSRDALPLSRRRVGARCRREDRAGTESRLRDGRGRRGPGRDRAARRARCSCWARRIWPPAIWPVQRDHDRHARLRRARRSRRPTTGGSSTTPRTAATSSSSTTRRSSSRSCTRRSGRAAAQRRGSVGGGLAGRDPGPDRRSSRRRTGSPRPTSTAGWSSAGRSSSDWDPPTRR